jgi:thiopeptide-type bacteriocin biosynthesis protein
VTGPSSPAGNGWAATFAVVRTPLLPFAGLAAMGEGLAVPGAPDAGLEAAVAADRSLLRERLSAFLARPEVREALHVASPSLEADLSVWAEHPDSGRGAKVERALVRYLGRMTARATPFGLLAGWGLASVGPRTRLDLGPRSEARRASRVDVHVLAQLAEQAARDPSVRAAVTLVPNATLRPVGGSLRYVEPRVDATGRQLFLSSVERSPWLESAVERCRAGARLAEAAEALASGFGVAREEAEAFVHSLVEARILVPDLEIRVTGEPPHGPFSAALRRSPATAPWADALDAAGTALRSLDAGGIGHGPERYSEALRPLEALPVALDPSLLVQVDLQRPGRLAIGEEVLRELARAVDALCRLVPEHEPRVLADFREAFRRRYGDAEVPLLEVLDEDSGIGFAGSASQERFPSPILAGLPFPAPPSAASEPGGAGPRLLLWKLSDALSSGRGEIEIGDEDLAGLAPAGHPAPESLAAFANLVARDPGGVEGEFRIFLRLALGPPGVALLGRFCHQDAELTARVREHLRAEEELRPDAVFAELVHLPEGRLGNVLCRPLLRAAEIPWLAPPGVPPEGVHAPADLLVSVAEERVVLRSRRDGREVLPRHTTAHDHEHGTGLYRFLATLPSQGRRAQVRFSWGALADAPFLPRVRIGRTIVHPACWRLQGPEIASLAGARGAALVRAARRLRDARGLPRRFAAGEGDNETPVDLDDVLSLESFAHLVRGRETVRLAELPWSLLPGAVRGDDGWYANELVVPMLRRPSSPPRPVGSARTRPPPPRRRHLPGSDWLLARVHCGASGADEVLARLAGPLARRLLAAGTADRWYFVRYGDPDWHLRLRFHGDPGRLAREALPALREAAEPLLADGLVERVVLDTHEPEVERYGGEAALPLAEGWFQADSDAALATLERLASEGRDEERALEALASIVWTWAEMGFEGEPLRRSLGAVRDGFREEFRADTALLRAVGRRYREVEPRLRELLPAASARLRPPEPGTPLAARAAATRALAAGYRRLDRAGELTLPLPAIASSLAHMSANRLLQAAARRHELVIHELACRYLESVRHRPA